jgi:hypothetical protein
MGVFLSSRIGVASSPAPFMPPLHEAGERVWPWGRWFHDYTGEAAKTTPGLHGNPKRDKFQNMAIVFCPLLAIASIHSGLLLGLLLRPAR